MANNNNDKIKPSTPQRGPREGRPLPTPSVINGQGIARNLPAHDPARPPAPRENSHPKNQRDVSS